MVIARYVYMDILKKNSFELCFIGALSLVGGLLFSFLFAMTVANTIGAIICLAFVFAGFYLTVITLLDRKEVVAEKQITKKAPARKEKFDFIAIETKNTVQKLPSQPISKPVEKKIEKIEIKKSPLESFKEDPIRELEETRDFILDLLNKTQSSYGRIEKIFGERMHKNTKTDIQSFLYLKQLNESLSRRLEQVIDLLDVIEKENKLSLMRSFELAHGPLTLPKDSFNTVLTENDKESPSLPREEWEVAIQSTIRKLSRKKTFHYALNYALHN